MPRFLAWPLLIICGSLTVGTTALWVRSYTHTDWLFHINWRHGRYGLRVVESAAGRCYLLITSTAWLGRFERNGHFIQSFAGGRPSFRGFHSDGNRWFAAAPIPAGFELMFPIPLLATASAVPAILAAWRLFRRKRLAGCCPDCDYDLRATPDRCPECGRRPRPALSPCA